MRVKGIVRALSALLGLLLCVTVPVSCTARATRPNIEIIVAGTETEFWTGVYAGAQAAAEEYNANVKMFGPGLEKDYSRQENILRQSIARNPGAIILAATDDAVMTGLADSASANGIVMIAVDSRIGAERPVPCVGSDNDALGRTLAKELKSRCAGGTVAVVSYIKESPAAKKREAGFLDEMSKSPGYSILETVYCDADADTAKALTLGLIAANDDLAAIACLNGEATIGAGRAMEKMNVRKTVLAGVDCSTEEAWLMERGILDVTLLQNPYAMGYYGLEAAIKRLHGELADDAVHTDVHIITKENMFSEENQRLIFPLS